MPIEFESEERLIKCLTDTNTISVAKSFFAQRSSSISEVVRTGVSGNTFRAFRNLNVQPSVTFRTWATDYITTTIQALTAISDDQSYAAYVSNATNNLCREWLDLTKTEMGYGRGAKLVNLTLKKLACLSSLSEQQRSTLISLLHVPLDSYTLIGLRSVAPSLCIPRNATMRFIETPNQYAECQSVIRTITDKARVPLIYYDVLAWDMPHRF